MFVLPNLADATADPSQAEPDRYDYDILARGSAGIGVVSGCTVTEQAIPDMTVAVAAGTVRSGGADIVIAGGNVVIPAAHLTQKRFDLIVSDSTGTLTRRGGTNSANPVFPDLLAGDIALAAVFIPPAALAVITDDIVDKRVTILSSTVVGGEDAAYSWQSTLTLAVGTGQRFYADRNGTIDFCRAERSSGDGTGTATLDVLLNGVSIFPVTPKPTIPIATFLGPEQLPDTVAFVKGDFFEVEIEATGGGTGPVRMTIHFS